jgi:hypothetical protein
MEAETEDQYKIALDELKRMVSERLDNMIKEMSDAKNASLLKLECRRLAKIDIN